MEDRRRTNRRNAFKMKNFHYILVFLLLFSALRGYGQNKCIKCDLDKLELISSHLDSISKSMISEFLCTFDKKCKDDAEFGEYSNELLFRVIEKAPKLFIEVLSTKSNETKELILNELSDPAVEMDYQKIFDRVKKGAPSSDLKTKILIKIKSIEELYKR
jgi:hypothetical protein